MINLNAPIVSAPVGYVVDLENPQRRGEAIIVWVGVTGLVMATVLLMIRAYTKIALAKKVTSDDCKFSFTYNLGRSQHLTSIVGCLLLAWVCAPMRLQSHY
jgi:predicted nucleic acid-binding Zn ribbon protein